MNLLWPAALWFGLTIPVVIVFYLLKRKRAVRLVASTVLWERFLAEAQASSPFQRLRHNWLLILQVLLLAAAVLALARPYFSGQLSQSRLQVVILDASASMQSVDDRPSRFEVARAQALKLVDGLHGAQQMVVLRAAAQTEVVQSETGQKAALRRALGACRVTDEPTRLKEAIKLAETLVRDRTDAEIHLFSDGGASDLSEFENRGLPLRYHPVGRRGQNVGVVAVDVRANPEDLGQRALFASVVNQGINAVTTTVELRFEGELIETRPASIGAGQTAALVFLARQSRDGVFELRVAADDDLAADNQAFVVSLLPQPVRVLLLTRGNRFLERALRAVERAEVTVANDLTEAEPAADVVVVDDVVPTVWPTRNLLAIHTAATNWFENVRRVEGPVIVDWRAAHPLMRFLRLENIAIAETMGVATPAWATSLADAADTPLLLAGERGPQRVVWVGFDVLRSMWPLRVSFPMFVANAVEWLNPAEARSGRLRVQAGSPLRLPITATVSGAEVTLPDGQRRVLVVPPRASELVFGDTAQRGVYRLALGTNEIRFCVNLLDAAESDTRPKPELIFGREIKVAATPLHRANLEVWRWIALAALVLLLAEWWYYHRRTA